MSRHIGEKLRRQIEKHAENICEHCSISIEDTYFGGEIDHIINIKHEGKNTAENLALARQPCNRNKGSDLGSLSTKSNKLVRFFNPRIDKWSDHFWLNKAKIESLTEISEVTAAIFGFNEEERLQERQDLIEIGRFPSKMSEKTKN